MDTILKVMNVTKVYHTGQNPSLHEVPFEAARGEFIGITERKNDRDNRGVRIRENNSAKYPFHD